jgi:hopanoid biosynthesis associated protein HpnK
MGERFLIVTADDFGLHDAVNEAVEQAARTGALTAASLMIAAPAAADAVRRARALPQLRVGLHLVLADGWAALAPRLIPALTDPVGRFGGGMVLKGLRYYLLPHVRRQLEAEIRAQYRAFVRTGLVLDHVNVHKHFHLHPSLLNMLLCIGRDYGIPAVRVPDEPLWFSARGGARVWGPTSRTLLAPWVARMRRRLRAAGVAYNDHIFGIACSGAMDAPRLLEILQRLPLGATEIYLHPATLSGRAICDSMSGYRHADELAALLNPRVLAAVASVARGGYRDLIESRPRCYAMPP